MGRVKSPVALGYRFHDSRSLHDRSKAKIKGVFVGFPVAMVTNYVKIMIECD